MASLVGDGAASPINPKNYRADQGFFLAISVALSVLIVFGFGQLAVRGITDPIGAPARVHVHALLLIGWLGVFCLQNWLAYRGNLSFHRKLGWAAMVLVPAIVTANLYVTVMVMADGRVPPFALAPFLAMGTVETLGFAAMVAWAVAMRRDTQWHRRLMIGATMALMNAAFNRLLAPLSGPPADVVSTACQLAIVGALAWHDRRVLGHVHKATVWLALIILLIRLLPHALAPVPPFAAFANSIAG